MEKKIRVLALCDSPTSATGFAQVSKNILNGLAKTGKYEIDVIGINYNGDYYDREKFPYNIYPAKPEGYRDMYGRGRVLDAINGSETKANLMVGWDLLFTIQDPFIIEGAGLEFPFAENIRSRIEMFARIVDKSIWFKWIGYFPIDSEIKENWVTRSIALANVPVAYCEYGKKEILKFDRDPYEMKFHFQPTPNSPKKLANIKIPSIEKTIQVIPHGVDVSVFKPLPKDEVTKFKKEFFGKALKEDTYLVVNISRNQPRKDLPRTLAVFSEFKKKVPNSHLYLHCQNDDLGGSIREFARTFGLIEGEDYSLPDSFSAGTGYSVETINRIYNAADVCITTTLGEGWGFITTESMAAKTPIIAPYITSIKDIFGDFNPKLPLEEQELRGIPVKAGSTSSEWISLGYSDNERIRPLTNVDDMVEKMLWVYNNPEKVEKITERAFKWVQNLKWENIVKQWDDLFTKTYNQLETERARGLDIDNCNRNDPCPCNSGLKFKKCHGGPEATDRFRDWFDEGGEKNK